MKYLYFSQTNDDDTRAKHGVHIEKYEESHLGGFRKIFPTDDNKEFYDKFFDQSTSLCAETAASRARTELSRLQREDIETKQKELDNFRKRFSGCKPAGSNKSGEARPESPNNEKKAKPRRPGLTINRRASSFHIPLYTSKSGLKAGENDAEENSRGRQDRHRVETVEF